MNREQLWHRLLYTGTVLIFVVDFLLVFIVIPNVDADFSPQALPENTVPAFWIIFLLHLAIAYAQVWTLVISKQGGVMKKGLLVVTGVILIVFSLMLMDGTFSFLDHPDPRMHKVAVSLFICIGCDFFAGILAFLAGYIRQHRTSIG
jgi:hypothetical protein